MILATMQKEQSAVALQSYPTKPDRELNLIMGCSEIAGWRNFVDQIQCGAETFLKRYSETHFNGEVSGVSVFLQEVQRYFARGYSSESDRRPRGLQRDESSHLYPIPLHQLGRNGTGRWRCLPV